MRKIGAMGLLAQNTNLTACAIRKTSAEVLRDFSSISEMHKNQLQIQSTILELLLQAKCVETEISTIG